MRYIAQFLPFEFWKYSKGIKAVYTGQNVLRLRPRLLRNFWLFCCMSWLRYPISMKIGIRGFFGMADPNLTSVLQNCNSLQYGGQLQKLQNIFSLRFRWKWAYGGFRGCRLRICSRICKTAIHCNMAATAKLQYFLLFIRFRWKLVLMGFWCRRLYEYNISFGKFQYDGQSAILEWAVIISVLNNFLFYYCNI